MDIKDLNKSQLLLLAILLSFVTSIATGIVTVTLMQQVPDSVTVPINRVIRQTVEKIQQVEGKTTVNTVVVKEEDLVVDAIAKNQSAIFTITKDANVDGQKMEISAGKGFAVSNEGIIVADAVLAGEDSTYFVSNASGKFKAEFISADPAGFSFLKIGVPLEEKDKIAFTLPTFGDLSKMKAGQKVIVLGSVLSTFVFDGDKDIKINLNKANGGALVVNLEGEALGIALFNETKPFAPIEAIKAAIPAP